MSASARRPASTGVWHALRAERGVTVALAYCALLVVLSVGATWLVPYEPTAILDPIQLRSQHPSWQHPLGTDPYARDVLSRVMAGARVSLLLAVTSVLVASGIGTVIGVCSGLLGGWVDRVLMRLVDVALAVPRVLLLLTIVAALGTLGTPMLAVVLGCTGWMGVSRLVRGEVLAMQASERLLAARALGVPTMALVRRHIVPELSPLLIVAATGGVGQVLLLESGLSFLGLGVAAPAASWGSVLFDLSDVVGAGRWLALGPGLVLVATVVALQRIGDAMHATRPGAYHRLASSSAVVVSYAVNGTLASSASSAASVSSASSLRSPPFAP